MGYNLRPIFDRFTVSEKPHALFGRRSYPEIQLHCAEKGCNTPENGYLKYPGDLIFNIGMYIVDMFGSNNAKKSALHSNKSGIESVHLPSLIHCMTLQQSLSCAAPALYFFNRASSHISKTVSPASWCQVI